METITTKQNDYSHCYCNMVFHLHNGDIGTLPAHMANAVYKTKQMAIGHSVYTGLTWLFYGHEFLWNNRL